MAMRTDLKKALVRGNPAIQHDGTRSDGVDVVPVDDLLHPGHAGLFRRNARSAEWLQQMRFPPPSESGFPGNGDHSFWDRRLDQETGFRHTLLWGECSYDEEEQRSTEGTPLSITRT